MGAVDITGVELLVEESDSVNVMFDGERVCSLSPARAVDRDGRRVMTWPRLLMPYLDGHTHVTITAHTSGEVIFDDEVRFGTGVDAVRVVDSAGRPLVLDKWGGLGRSFAMSGTDEVEALARGVHELLRDLNDKVGVPAFMAYGTLLGAVRTGHVIGHDFDADISYLSSHTHPADIAFERAGVQRRLVELGWRATLVRASMLQVYLDGAASDRHIDIFVSYFHDGRFNVDAWVEGRLDPSHVLPLGEVELEGLVCAAPADPAAVLALTYGPTWMIPDPAFAYVRDRAQARRVEGWMGNYRAGRGTWRRHYRELAVDEVVSDFATWVRPRISPGDLLLDVGCGFGADTRYLVEQTGAGVGWDFAQTAIEPARELTAAAGSAATFEVVNVADVREVVACAALVAGQEGRPVVYGRFVLDSLRPAGRANLWSVCRALLRGGGSAYFEFGTSGGFAVPGVEPYGWSRRRYRSHLRDEIEAAGATIVAEEAVARPEPRPDDPRPAARFPATRRVEVRWS